MLAVQGIVRPRRRSLTVPVEVGFFPGAAVGSPKPDFPRQRPGSTHLPPVQAGSDCVPKKHVDFQSLLLKFRESTLTIICIYIYIFIHAGMLFKA